MTVAPPESPVIEGLRSLEVRWILPGQLQPAVAGWLGRFPAETVSGERIVTATPGRATESACAAELTEIRLGGQAWWSLGLEATGPAGRLRSALHSTAAQLAPPLPCDVELDMSHCHSYAQWLSWHTNPG